MALDTTARRSRRAILVGALGGVAASALAAVGRPGLVAAGGADDGSQILVGSQFYSCEAQTILGNQGTNDTVFSAFSSTASGHGGGTGIYGSSGSGYGVRAHSETSHALHADTPGGVAVFGTSQSGYGVMGFTSSGMAGTYGSAWNGSGVQGDSQGGIGVYGTSQGGHGVYGVANAGSATAGTFGVTDNSSGFGAVGANASGDGVLGYSGPLPLPAPIPKTGVFGYSATDVNSRGVVGKTTAGQGVRGEATNGIGVRGYASGTGIGGLFTASGVALKVEGRATFTRSGRASVLANASSVDVTVPGGISSTAFVVATVQTHVAGVTVEGVHLNYPSTGKARIYLSKVASTTTTTPVGWFAIG
jgi:hypothetical protein